MKTSYSWNDNHSDEWKRYRDTTATKINEYKQQLENLQQQQQEQAQRIATAKQEWAQKKAEADAKALDAIDKKSEAKKSTDPDVARQAETAQREAEVAKAQALEAQKQLQEEHTTAQEIRQQIKYVEQNKKEVEKLQKEVSQSVGENFGHQYCTEELGYVEILHGDSKTIRQGFDSVYFDPQRQQVVVVEFKGQNSELSDAQKRIEWTPEVADKILQGKGIYQRASEQEWNAAIEVKEAYKNGELRYEVVRTKVDSEGQISTEHELKHRPEESAQFRTEGSDSWSQSDNQSINRHDNIDSFLGKASENKSESSQINTNTEISSETKTG